jgi:ABC-type proline/glycine betaine transport system permease subunit
MSQIWLLLTTMVPAKIASWLSFPELPFFDLADWIDRAVRFLKENFSGLFDFIRTVISGMLSATEAVLGILPWWLLIIMVLTGAWFATRSVRSSIIYGLMLIIIGLFGYWDMMNYTLSIVIVSVILSLLFGLPTGVWMAESEKVKTIMTPLLDTMQTMPSFVYLIPAVILFGLGRVPAVIATMIYAVPPVIRLTSHAILNVDSETAEAAKAFGCTRMQSLWQVRIPQAAPTIMAGVNQTIMMAVAMVVTSSMIGAKGLGEEVLISINRMEVGRGFEAGISIVFIAIIIDRLSQGVTRSLKKKSGKED